MGKTLLESTSSSSQRLPFFFLDHIVEIQERKLIAIKNVSGNEAFFIGHFPGMPVMPGVLILESLTQAAGVLVSKIAKCSEQSLVLAGSERLRFRRQVAPGDQLILEVELVEWDGATGKLKGTARVGDQVAADGNLTMKRAS